MLRFLGVRRPAVPGQLPPKPRIATPLNHDPFDLIEADLVAGAVIELGGAGGLVGGDGLGVFDRAAVEQVGGDAGGAEGVAVGGDAQFCLAHPSLDHAEDIDAVHAVRGDGAALGHGAPQRGALFVSDPCGPKIGIEVFLGVVVSGDLVEFAALFVEAQPPALALLVVVFHVHADDGADPGEGVDHGGQQRPIPEPRGLGEVDRVEQRAGLAGGKHGGLALLDHVFGTSDGSGRIGWQDLAHDQVVEQGPEGGEMLLDGGQGIAVLHLLDIGGDGKGSDCSKRQVAGLAPPEETAGGGRVGEAGIGV